MPAQKLIKANVKFTFEPARMNNDYFIYQFKTWIQQINIYS
jgi:hypothetical protein